jgi:hypothetical protein
MLSDGLRKNNIPLATRKIWTGVLLANLASYAVLAPLHYYLTRPQQQIREFLPNAAWSTNSTDKIIFVDAATRNLKMSEINRRGLETIVPLPVADFYLFSSNLNLCLFRGFNGNLYLYRQKPAETNLVSQTKEFSLINQLAFSPSGRFVTFASEDRNDLELTDLHTGYHFDEIILHKFSSTEVSVTWSTNEDIFYIGGLDDGAKLICQILPGDELSVTETKDPRLPLFVCYGRVHNSYDWFSQRDWPIAFNSDFCGNVEIATDRGPESGLFVYKVGDRRAPILHLSVDPGLLHLARFDFEDTAFLPDCRECLFQANDYIYLLNIPDKKVGTVAHGSSFILLTPRYQKQFDP